MTVSSTIRSPSRLKHGTLAALAAAVAVAGGITAIASLGGGDGTETRSGSPSRAAVLSTLTPEQRRYVEWVSSAPPAQVAAAFGTDGVPKAPVPRKPGANVR